MNRKMGVPNELESYENKINMLEENNIPQDYEVKGIISDLRKEIEDNIEYLETVKNKDILIEEMKEKNKRLTLLVFILIIVIVGIVVAFYFGLI